MTPTITTNGNGNSGARSGSRLLLIFLKEIREIFRDKRTIRSVIIGPLVITPLMFAGIGLIVSTQTEKEKTKELTIGIVGGAQAPSLLAALQQVPNLKVEPVSPSDAEGRIRERKLNAVAILPPDYEHLNADYKPAPIQIMLDEGEANSQAAAGRLQDAFTKLGEQIVLRRLQAHNLSADVAHPFTLQEKPIQSGGNSASFFLAMILPYTLVVSAFSGCVFTALDQVAGEKERGTLETLLVSPASRRDIVLGKFAAVLTTCILSSVLSIVGLVITFSLRGNVFALASQGGLHLSPVAVGVTLMVILPLSVLFAGLLLTVSTYARNQREAQTYVAPLLLMVLMPAMVSMFIGTDVGRPIALVPVLGATIIIKQALSGSYDPAFILLAFGASIVYAAVALTYAIRLFQKESVLVKT
ncbi:MAG TPA: ABC transporter permease [Chthonomonadaceae bacterium]|nr:ABC transporter permease [Chthonomonadaceae bacterium]